MFRYKCVRWAEGWNGNAVAYVNGKWFIAGSGGKVSISADGGYTWIDKQIGGATESLTAVAGNGQTVACTTSTGRVLFSTDSGATWKAAQLSASNLKAIAYHAGSWYVAGVQEYIARSPDLTNWVMLPQALGVGKVHKALASTPLGLLIGSSTAAFLWTGSKYIRLALPEPINVNSVGYDNGLYWLAGGGGENNHIYVSSDCVAWRDAPGDQMSNVTSLAGYKGHYIACGPKATWGGVETSWLAESATLEAWKAVPPPKRPDGGNVIGWMLGAATDGTRVVVVGTRSCVIVAEPDTVTPPPPPPPERFGYRIDIPGATDKANINLPVGTAVEALPPQGTLIRFKFTVPGGEYVVLRLPGGSTITKN